MNCREKANIQKIDGQFDLLAPDVLLRLPTSQIVEVEAVAQDVAIELDEFRPEERCVGHSFVGSSDAIGPIQRLDAGPIVPCSKLGEQFT